MGVLAGLLQSLLERQKDVAWIDEREGVGDGKVEEEKETPILLSVSTALKRPRSSWHFYFDRNVRTYIYVCVKLNFLFNSA